MKPLTPLRGGACGEQMQGHRMENAPLRRPLSTPPILVLVVSRHSHGQKRKEKRCLSSNCDNHFPLD